jgi:hypothetical protein
MADSEVFEVLHSLGDFESFKDLILSYNNDHSTDLADFGITVRGLKG